MVNALSLHHFHHPLGSIPARAFINVIPLPAFIRPPDSLKVALNKK